MDDILILDIDRNKLKKLYKILKDKISDLKLNVNNKSNIYKCSIGFNFVGFKYQIIDNKLAIYYNHKTYYRVKRRLKHKENDCLSYKKTLASYNGYFKQIKKSISVEEVDFKVKTIEIYNNFKNKNNESLIIVKEEIFYKTYGIDAIIIWYLFDYLLKDDVISFGNNSYDKVISKLKKSNISFKFVKDDKVMLEYDDNFNTFNSYVNLASLAYEKKVQEINLVNKLKKVIDNKDCYSEINSFLDTLINEV